MNLEDCLSPELRDLGVTIEPISAGLSGAGVYRVEAAQGAFVLKVSNPDEPLAEWRRKVEIRRRAAAAGLAPPIVHVEESRRAVLSEFAGGRSFPAYYLDPNTRDAALEILGRTLRRVHELPLPDAATGQSGREFLLTTWEGLAGFPLPDFVGDAVRRVLAEQPPAAEGPPVLSHNDVNPTNLAFDGERLLLLDWETSGPNEASYDAASIAVFFRMGDEACRRMLSAYHEASVELSPGFVYNRRLIAALCGAVFFQLVRKGGHSGATGEETLESTLSYSEVVQLLRAGKLIAATPEGQWRFGLAMIKTSLTFPSAASPPA